MTIPATRPLPGPPTREDFRSAAALVLVLDATPRSTQGLFPALWQLTESLHREVQVLAALGALMRSVHKSLEPFGVGPLLPVIKSVGRPGDELHVRRVMGYQQRLLNRAMGLIDVPAEDWAALAALNAKCILALAPAVIPGCLRTRLADPAWPAVNMMEAAQVWFGYSRWSQS